MLHSELRLSGTGLLPQWGDFFRKLADECWIKKAGNIAISDDSS